MVELSYKPSPDADIVIEPVPDHLMPEAAEGALGRKVPLVYRAIYYVFGFAVEVLTNDEAVLPIVGELWGRGRQLHPNPMLQVRIIVSEGGPTECPPAPVIRAQRTLLTVVADAHNHATCDLKDSFSVIWLTQAALKHPDYLRLYFIETATAVLITTSYATALHAACVSRHGHGMLLAGSSGAGKSTLSYACARAGWTFTSDDGSLLLRDGDGPRVFGNCGQVRFRPTAKDLFPELQGYDLTPRIQGKPSIEIPTSELGLITAEFATVNSIVLLNRQPSAAAELISLPRSFSIEHFRAGLAGFPIEVQKVQVGALRQLSSVDVYELRYSDLQPAIDRLDLLVRETRMVST
jgi:hypothetical protein